MRTTRNLICDASFSPATLKVLGAVFDTVWASVARDFVGHIDETETGRMRLAAIILDLARDGQLGPHQIVRTAARLMRQLPKVPTSRRSNRSLLGKGS
jgi:hypothetical protein